MVHQIESALRSALDIHYIKIIDNSHKHAGHKQNINGGHYEAHIVSNDFEHKSLINRHRMIYKILDDMMKTKIHALSIKVQTVKEFNF